MDSAPGGNGAYLSGGAERFFAVAMRRRLVRLQRGWKACRGLLRWGYLLRFLTARGSCGRDERAKHRRRWSGASKAQSAAHAPSWRPLLGHGLAPLAEAIEGSFEADWCEALAFVGGRRGHQPAQQVMGGQKEEQFLLHHGGLLAAQRFHAEGGFQIVEGHFHAPAPGMGGEDLRGWVEARIEQGGDENEVLGPKALARNGDAQKPHGEFPGQRAPPRGLEQRGVAGGLGARQRARAFGEALFGRAEVDPAAAGGHGGDEVDAGLVEHARPRHKGRRPGRPKECRPGATPGAGPARGAVR